MRKSQVINQDDLTSFNAAKSDLWEACCLLEIIQEKLISELETVHIGTALRSVVKTMNNSLELLEEI